MTAAALLVVMAAAALMTYAGLSPALGAFLSGIMLAESSYRHELEADIEPFRGLLLGLFFISVGMIVDPRDDRALLAAAAGRARRCSPLIKVGVVYGLVRLHRQRSRDRHPHRAAAAAGRRVRLRPVLDRRRRRRHGAGAGDAAGRAGHDDHGAHAAAGGAGARASPAAQTAPEREETFDGRARARCCSSASAASVRWSARCCLPAGVEVTTIDNDVEMIEAAERFGFKVYYGDGARLDVLRAAGAGKARLICVCVERKETATRIVELVRSAFPLTRVFVRAFDRVHALELLEQGRPLPDARDLRERDRLRPGRARGARSARRATRPSSKRTCAAATASASRSSSRAAPPRPAWTASTPGPVPRPEPLTAPRQKGVALNPDELEEASEEERSP